VKGNLNESGCRGQQMVRVNKLIMKATFSLSSEQGKEFPSGYSLSFNKEEDSPIKLPFIHLLKCLI